VALRARGFLLPVVVGVAPVSFECGAAPADVTLSDPRRLQVGVMGLVDRVAATTAQKGLLVLPVEVGV